jgi:hypothetical protein
MAARLKLGCGRPSPPRPAPLSSSSAAARQIPGPPGPVKAGRHKKPVTAAQMTTPAAAAFRPRPARPTSDPQGQNSPGARRVDEGGDAREARGDAISTPRAEARGAGLKCEARN